MPTYTFKNHHTGEQQDVKCSIPDLDKITKDLLCLGWVRVIVPIAVKDSGSGRN